MQFQWLPHRRDLPGMVLALVLGSAALLGVRMLPKTPWISAILVALLLGGVVLNSPLRHLVGLERVGAEREPDRFASGLRFTGKWVLRLGIILMGLEVRTTLFGTREVVLIVAAAPAAIPSAFFAAHAMGAALGIRRPFADLLGIGTMICGASAVNASAPVVRARRGEQGIAIGVVFLFSIVAMLTYQPIATAVGLSPRFAGIWAGLAVNDLSSAVAVGKQMGGSGGVMSAAAKSLRILMLAPTLIALSLLRRQQSRQVAKSGIIKTLPLFILGYVLLALVRAVGDRWFGDHSHWQQLLAADGFVVDVLLCTVAAGIGLHIDVRTLATTGGRAVLVGGTASLWMAVLTFGMVSATAFGHGTLAFGIGVVGLLGSAALHRIVSTPQRRLAALRVRFGRGDGLSMEEAGMILQAAVDDDGFDRSLATQVMERLQPAIGELIVAREQPLATEASCRWIPYWEGANGWELGAACREPRTVTSIHAHARPMIGKWIEGDAVEIRFEEDGDALKVTQRAESLHNVVTESAPGFHLVSVVGDATAIDLQLRGPAEAIGRIVAPSAGWDRYEVGTRVEIA